MVHAPTPTVWPAVLATGVALAAAGVVTSWLFIVAGAIISAIALTGWIVEMAREAHG